MASSSTFKPFVPAAETRPEFTLRALLLGGFFAVVFGAVTVYVGLRAGLTVAASIPISVLSISILRAFGKASILENNIVQTVGNAGQSIASGVIFTLPALIFLGFDLESTRIFALALFGGWLGVLFMIPLRRQLIVDEHDTLIYPEGTACADVLVAGDRGGSSASRVFFGLGLGALYTLFQNENLFALWPSGPNYEPDLGTQHLLKGAAIRADCTPEYLGVGYIIGIRVAAILFAGGVFSWLVMMPAIYFFGSRFNMPIYPGTTPIAQMDPSSLWRIYVRPMGAGAVAAAGLITLLRTAPTILSALADGFKQMGRKSKDQVAAASSVLRTAHDLPMSVVVGGSALLVVLMVAFLQFHPVPGAQVGFWANVSAALLVVVFGFLFVAVSARIVGIVGSSSSPVSGMTIATLMATTAIFLVRGWTAPAFGALAITIGGIVCIAASNAGDTSQDLKTGYLIGATPWKQQAAVMAGVIISVFSIGATLNGMNRGLESFQRMPQPIAVTSQMYADGVQSKGPFSRDNFQLSSKAGGKEVDYERPLLYLAQCHRLNHAGRWQIPDESGHQPDRHPVDTGHRQREGGRASRQADGNRDQRHPFAQAALGSGAAWCRAGDCGGAARGTLADLRRGRIPFHCHDARHLCRRRHALDGRSRDAASSRQGGRCGLPVLARALANRSSSLLPETSRIR